MADTAHASVDNALRLLGLDALVVPTDTRGRFTGGALEAALADDPSADDVGIVIASGGSTNGGVVDDLAGLADSCAHPHVEAILEPELSVVLFRRDGWDAAR